MAKAKALIVDDDASLRDTLVEIFRNDGYEVEGAPSGERALEVLDDSFDVALVDLVLPGIDGIETLRQAKQKTDRCDVVMVTSHGAVETAVEAMRLGAADYITKPVHPLALLARMDKLLQQRRLAGEVMRLRRELEGRHQFGSLMGQNPKMQAVYELVESISDTDANVLIQGETGTGKELVARAIHYNSSRSTKPFVKVDCAALTETLLESELFGHVRGAFTGATRDRDGRFRTADGGTIFLDEIANVPKSLQVKLLRALQDSEFEPVGGDQTIKVNVRVIAASNEDLGKLAQEGRFRPDLYYRINVVRVLLPPLRDRRDDIPLLALHFLEKYREKNRRQVKSITPAAMTRLLAYEWPGNVRELENAMERAVILAKGEAVAVADLPPFHEPTLATDAAGATGSLSDAVAEAEKRAILDALERCGNDKEQAAKELGISRASLYSKIKRYDIKAEG